MRLHLTLLPAAILFLTARASEAAWQEGTEAALKEANPEDIKAEVTADVPTTNEDTTASGSPTVPEPVDTQVSASPPEPVDTQVSASPPEPVDTAVSGGGSGEVTTSQPLVATPMPPTTLVTSTTSAKAGTPYCTTYHMEANPNVATTDCYDANGKKTSSASSENKATVTAKPGTPYCTTYHMEANPNVATTDCYDANGKKTSSGTSGDKVTTTAKPAGNYPELVTGKDGFTTSCSYWHAEASPNVVSSTCSAYGVGNKNEQITMTTTKSVSGPTNTAPSGTTREVCTQIYGGRKWCYNAPPPSGTQTVYVVPTPDPKYIPQCKQDQCSIPLPYFPQKKDPSWTLKTDADTDKSCPLLLAKDWDAKVVKADPKKVIVTLFYTEWIPLIEDQVRYASYAAVQYNPDNKYSYYRVDLDSADIAGRALDLKIDTLPTWIFWRDNKILDTIKGPVALNQLRNLAY